MLSGATTIGPGGSTTNVSGSYSTPYSGLLDYVRNRLNAKQAAQEQASREAATRASYARATAPPVTSNPSSSALSAATPGMNAEREMAMAKIADARAEQAKAYASMNPAPMKYSYLYGTPGFLTMDDTAMNAFQRQAYLPQGSSNNAAQDAYANSATKNALDQEMSGIEDQWKRSGGYGPTV